MADSWLWSLRVDDTLQLAYFGKAAFLLYSTSAFKDIAWRASKVASPRSVWERQNAFDVERALYI